MVFSMMINYQTNLEAAKEENFGECHYIKTTINHDSKADVQNINYIGEQSTTAAQFLQRFILNKTHGSFSIKVFSKYGGALNCGATDRSKTIKSIN